MIAFPAGVKVWIAGGVTDMRCGMNSLALKVQEGLGRDPHGGEVFCFRGRKGDLIKVLWHDGVGMSLYLKRLEAGKFIWPVSQNGSAVPVSSAQLGYLPVAQSPLDATTCNGRIVAIIPLVLLVFLWFHGNFRQWMMLRRR
ncbi:IS66 family insertion sequence element accessory protein TnpB [Pararhizobium polonicum]|uniref:IS66 family insertion sequence element accessory protein TnpB n=1 Tax=Pararhizobium polonicum TaxID=1612624 RepID=UPI000A4A3AF4